MSFNSEIVKWGLCFGRIDHNIHIYIFFNKIYIISFRNMWKKVAFGFEPAYNTGVLNCVINVLDGRRTRKARF